VPHQRDAIQARFADAAGDPPPRRDIRRRLVVVGRQVELVANPQEHRPLDGAQPRDQPIDLPVEPALHHGVQAADHPQPDLQRRARIRGHQARGVLHAGAVVGRLAQALQPGQRRVEHHAGGRQSGGLRVAMDRLAILADHHQRLAIGRLEPGGGLGRAG
jgi:hypothetical protein